MLHEDELDTSVDRARALVSAHAPDLAGFELRPAGNGTDNVMWRIGEVASLRLPRTAGVGLSKEVDWLPRLTGLPTRIPRVLHHGDADRQHPGGWAIYDWAPGTPVDLDLTLDWTALGRDLALFVRALHAVPGAGAPEDPRLIWYRAGSLAAVRSDAETALGTCRVIDDPRVAALDWDLLLRLFRQGAELPDSSAPPCLLHADLKPTNVLVDDAGRLSAVIDWGCLAWGLPDAEHAALWDYPPATRLAYADELGLDEPTWLRARAWAIMVACSGIPYYWSSFPEFVAECLTRLTHVQDDHRTAQRVTGPPA